ncbi:MAG: EAL domain-containing protein [Steroidobacteraceae bacterium]
MSHQLPATSVAEPARVPAWRRAFNWIRFDRPLGIAPRLTIAFAAVATLAVVANVVSEHGLTIARTIENRYVASPSVESQPEADALPVALEQMHRATLARADQDDTQRERRYEEAVQALVAASEAHRSVLAPTLDPDSLVDLEMQAAAHIGLAEELVRASDSRRLLLLELGGELASLDTRVIASLDRTWRIVGRAPSREYLVDVNRLLDGMGARLVAFAVPQGYAAEDVRAMQRDEAALTALLRDNGPSIVRAEGQDWLDKMQRDLGRAGRLRNLLVRMDLKRESRIEEFTASHSALTAAIRKASASFEAAKAFASARRQSNDVLSAISEREGRRRTLFAWLSVGILLLLLATSVNTVVSVVRPVRRLLAATQRLAQGAANVTVPRGGIRELDQLAVSFNHMAEQLAAAQALASEYHGQLEAKVEKRTRQLLHLAEHDSLTRLPNRRQLLSHLDRALRSAAARNDLVGVLFLDLDHFKYVNDSMGHAFGDRVLQAIAERLSSTVGAAGFTARLGGDEFTVVYEGAAGVAQIQDAGESLVRAFQEPLFVDGRELLMSLSVGASVFPGHGRDPEALLRAADAALFRAKASGRSQLSMFSPELLDAATAKFATEQGLRRAVERGEFELFFQPEVEIATLETSLVESLLRWRLPTGAYAYPQDFLPVAEDCGLIREIGDWVLRSAVEQAALWHRADWPEVRVAVNVSSLQLLDRRFVDTVQDLLTHHALPPGCIEIELTENVLQTGQHTIEALRQLRALGVGVALDDFGTGYSSLASLEQLPLTRVKLDRSLIASIDTSARSQAIATAIIALCQSLKLEITAEGVENRAQLDWLIAHPSMCIQGYLLSRPVPADLVLPAVSGMPARLRALLHDHAPVIPIGRQSRIRRIR